MRPAESLFFDVRGLKYHVRHWPAAKDAGAAAGRLVLLHGWMDVSASFQFQPFSTASTCGANASFSSTRSMSFHLRPVRWNRRSTAGTWPMPIRDGSTPAAAQPTNQPIGSRPSLSS